MLEGAGGNIGFSVGSDAAFLVDDQFAPLTERIQAAVAAVTERPVRFVLNTHWHGDHTGGNENLGKAGALIVAHENVRRRMGAEQLIEFLGQLDTVPASPMDALPVVTFTEAVTFHLNGDEIHALHVRPAHTDGDAVVRFRKANVVHMGDTFFNRVYPFIDLDSGGSVDGMIAVADTVLGMIDGETKVIPGHGPLGDREALRTFRDMLADVRDRVREQVEGGASIEDILASTPTATFDAEWGGGLIKGDDLVRVIYRDVTGRGPGGAPAGTSR